MLAHGYLSSLASQSSYVYCPVIVVFPLRNEAGGMAKRSAAMQWRKHANACLWRALALYPGSVTLPAASCAAPLCSLKG